MTEVFKHDSRDETYRSPGGARPCGEVVTLRLAAPGDRAVLRLWQDGVERRLEMAREDGLWVYRLALPDGPCTLWYFFIAFGPAGARYYGNAADRLGGEGQLWPGEPPSFQITVYRPDYRTPEWMGRGAIYQIMVDRFCAARPPDERRRPEGGRLHAAWDEPPTLLIDPQSHDNVADDFFGGDLRGIEQKLPYLAELGVTALYLNPIFRARSNHKYDVGDYHEIDRAFGDLDDFRSLCAAARGHGIRVVLDGVFSHTGDDSRYFNRYGRYDSVGAYQSPDSPYANWYSFRRRPDDYDCWWGFSSLPTLNKRDEGLIDFLVGGESAVASRWLGEGASGWRLDVADELPMEFLRRLRRRVKQTDPGAALIGEVWEDASNKVAYGELRSYCLGDTLDGAMNYPLRTALFSFMLGHIDAPALCRALDSLRENYAPQFLAASMNLLGSHDRPRAINVLAGADDDACPRERRVAASLTPASYALGRARLLALFEFVCALPGMPCVYYGDEAGAQGGGDPFCRGTFPWGREDRAMVRGYAAALRRRAGSAAMTGGELRLIPLTANAVAALRWAGSEWAACCLSRAEYPMKLRLPPSLARGANLPAPLTFRLPPMSAVTLTGTRKSPR
ncbi:MAG: glycoside hydrolase family 13 protein [Clostridiales bacterium]|nr:glycoside hydrolase family 13 protein [Clostridiales bacterium]